MTEQGLVFSMVTEHKSTHCTTVRTCRNTSCSSSNEILWSHLCLTWMTRSMYASRVSSFLTPWTPKVKLWTVVTLPSEADHVGGSGTEPSLHLKAAYSHRWTDKLLKKRFKITFYSILFQAMKYLWCISAASSLLGPHLFFSTSNF